MQRLKRVANVRVNLEQRVNFAKENMLISLAEERNAFCLLVFIERRFKSLQIRKAASSTRKKKTYIKNHLQNLNVVLLSI